MKSKTARLALFAVICVLLVGLDQLTKMQAVRYLKGGNEITLIPNALYLLYVENYGAAFGMMQGMRFVFYIITAVVAFFVLYTVARMPAEAHFRPLYIVCALIFSGALGNLIDRAMQHYVVDFIYFSPIDFPVFNVADIYVTVGCAALVALFMFVYKDEDFAFLRRRG